MTTTYDETENYTSSYETWWVTVNSIPSSGGSSRSKSELTFSYEWDCENGILEIETEEEIEVRLMSLRDYSTYKKNTNNYGIVSFILTIDGTYRVFTESTSEFNPLQKDISLEFCKEDIESEEPDNDVPGDEEDEEEIDDEEIVPIDTTELENLLNNVENELQKALNENKEVTEAQQKLKEARDAFNRGEYDLAEQLTNEALLLILNAEAQQPVIDDEPIEGNVTEIEEEEKEEIKGFDWLPYIIATIVLLIPIIWFGFKYMKKQENN